ncbi:MAG: ATP-binding cassette domain-containing protein [Deltaproteobacteria bacterium]|nr:ATP-binding cassette domain-containing protein [Deltaproteobacteria bacterium]
MIDVQDLVKTFGSHRAVDGVSFQVNRGEVLGFLGPNGAGKSTTMRVITGFLPPDGGTVRVGGHDVRSDSLRARELVGYLPESSPTYPEMTVEEFLRFMAEARGFLGADVSRRVDRVVEQTSLGDVRRQIIETLSKGYRQRTCLAQALIHDPPVLILDEPTDGLDPNQKHEVRDLIRAMSAEKTIILSTHILEEMEAVCTRAVVIAKGKIRLDGTPSQLAAQSRWHQAVTFLAAQDDGGKWKEPLQALKDVDSVAYRPAGAAGPAAYTVFPAKGAVIQHQVGEFLREKKIAIDQLFVERGRMDEVFRGVTVED